MQWTGILCALTVFASAVSLFLAWRSVRIAHAALEYAEASERSPASQLESLRNTLNEHTELLSELANRIKMMKVRKALTHTDDGPRTPRTRDGLPDPSADPDGWRNAMNARLARARVGV